MATEQYVLGESDASAAMDAGKGGTGSDVASGQESLPFDQEFRIRAAVRDTIRQQILENMLDDRHDLTGNSVYGLKFDTTVIPGTNTHRRAFVRVILTTDQLSYTKGPEDAAIGANAIAAGLPDHVRHYYDSPSNDVEGNVDNALHKSYQLYRSWLESIEFRLNSYVNDAFNARFASDPCICSAGRLPGEQSSCAKDSLKVALRIDELVWNALEVVLGMNRSQGEQPPTVGPGRMTFPVDIPAPWSRFFAARVSAEGDCLDRPWFEIASLDNHVYLFTAENVDVPGEDPMPASMRDDFVQRSVIDQTLGTAFRIPGWRRLIQTDQAEYARQYEAAVPRYVLSDNLIRYVAIKKRTFQVGNYRFFMLPTGFFNFVESIIKTDAYSYAIFPKNDVVGILSDSRVAGGVAGSGGGRWFDFVQALRRSQTSSTLVGFGDGGRPIETDKQAASETQDDSEAASLARTSAGLGGPRQSVQFGWVIGGRDGVEPLQKAQLALVSVPAWTSELRLKIAMGWLDRESREQIRRQVSLTVPLPPDFEAFDSFVGGSQLRRQPKILDEFFDPAVLTACERGRILIPGYRLWRSTTVTLGAQRANRITVLPNMRGIIAEFDQVAIPTTDFDLPSVTEPISVPVTLRVWTSEGMDVVGVRKGGLGLGPKPVRVQIKSLEPCAEPSMARG